MSFARTMGRLGAGAVIMIAAAVPVTGMAEATTSGSATAQTGQSTSFADSPAGTQSSGECISFLFRVGYTDPDGSKTAACNVGARGGAFNFTACWGQLVNSGVSSHDAGTACDLAG